LKIKDETDGTRERFLLVPLLPAPPSRRYRRTCVCAWPRRLRNVRLHQLRNDERAVCQIRRL